VIGEKMDYFRLLEKTFQKSLAKDLFLE
jgi:hypothetical protein